MHNKCKYLFEMFNWLGYNWLDHVEKALTRAGNVTSTVESFFATGDLKNSESGLGLMQVKK